LFYNNFIEKFDAYRLKLKEIKLLRRKKTRKTPYFKGFFLIFLKAKQLIKASINLDA
jgi:hypothetical protein